MSKTKLTDDALLGQLLSGLWRKVTQIDAILKTGYLPQRAVEALVDAKLGIIEVTRRLQTALESEPEE